MSQPITPNADADLQHMHAEYRRGGMLVRNSPVVVYGDKACPHQNCTAQLQVIDFYVDHFAKRIRSPLVTAWWDDTGFAGRCPKCGNWIHFTIRGKRAITPAEAATLLQLPTNWASEAVIM